MQQFTFLKQPCKLTQACLQLQDVSNFRFIWSRASSLPLLGASFPSPAVAPTLQLLLSLLPAVAQAVEVALCFSAKCCLSGSMTHSDLSHCRSCGFNHRISQRWVLGEGKHYIFCIQVIHALRCMVPGEESHIVIPAGRGGCGAETAGTCEEVGREGWVRRGDMERAWRHMPIRKPIWCICFWGWTPLWSFRGGWSGK